MERISLLEQSLLIESFYRILLFQLLSLPCDGRNSWKWLYPIKDCSLGCSHAQAVSALQSSQPLRCCEPGLPVPVQSRIYTFDSMNERFGFAMVTWLRWLSWVLWDGSLAPASGYKREPCLGDLLSVQWGGIWHVSSSRSLASMLLWLPSPRAAAVEDPLAE